MSGFDNSTGLTTGPQTISGVKTFTSTLKISIAGTGDAISIAENGVDPWFHINDLGIGGVGNNVAIPYIAIESSPAHESNLRLRVSTDLVHTYLEAFSQTGASPIMILQATDDIWLWPGSSASGGGPFTKKVRVLAGNGMTIENVSGAAVYFAFNAAGHLIGTAGSWISLGGTSPPAGLIDLRPAAADKALFMKLAGSATGNAIEVQDSTAAGLFNVSSVGFTRVVALRNIADNGPWFQMTATAINVLNASSVQALKLGLTGAAIQVTPAAVGDFGILINQKVSQTAALFQITASDGTTVFARFNKDGYLMIRKNTVPADGDLAANDLAFWYDSTNGVGAAKVMFKAKQADGTVVTGTVALV